jgi:hypothetical protein
VQFFVKEEESSSEVLLVIRDTLCIISKCNTRPRTTAEARIIALHTQMPNSFINASIFGYPFFLNYTGKTDD